MGLISFRIDWFDLLTVQGTLESFLEPQFESMNSSALNHLYGPILTSIHDYIALTICTLVDKMMSLLFNTPSRFVITSLPRSRHLLTS